MNCKNPFMKLRNLDNTCVNFINIYARVFLYEFWHQSQNVTRKAAKKDIRTKKAHKKTLMKLKAGGPRNSRIFYLSICLLAVYKCKPNLIIFLFLLQFSQLRAILTDIGLMSMEFLINFFNWMKN